MNRRNFLKLAAGTAGTTLMADKAKGSAVPIGEEFVGVLCDTTRCIGCRSCEVACAENHGLDVPDVLHDDALEAERATSDRQWTVVNRYRTDKGDVYVKKQCMHCWQPACASACLTNAMYKTHKGPVIWRASKCLGCRLCMVSCPFDIPKFEYHEWNPKIQKCTMCWERTQAGNKTACVEACPTDALMFGTKRKLMEIARMRIYNHPDDYLHRIYGEHAVGGTGWLYLASVPFSQLGFREDLGVIPYPEYTREFLYAVPVILVLWPSLLAGISYLTKREEAVKKGEEHE